MRILYLISMVALSIGCFAGSVQKNDSNPKTKRKIGNSVYEGKQWVVLVTGSSGWENYRHQADICHAYQIVKANGIPEENIITMMVDDIAYNKKNPIKGKIYNKPYGHNVYKGVKIDYRANDVNSTNFLNIITGNKEAMQSVGSGKVVEGGPHDTIFINFVGYGDHGTLALPYDLLYADELNNALSEMYANGKYSKMLMYVEAPKAGSMFDGILNGDMGALAITATGPYGKTTACYYVGYKSHKLYLGDVFSVTWMENLDETSADFSTVDRTIFNYFSYVRNHVTTSDVMIYGDYHVGTESLSTFIGYQKTPAVSKHNEKLNSKIFSHNANKKMTAREIEKFEIKRRQNDQMRLVIDGALKYIYSEVVTKRPELKQIVGEYGEPHYNRPTLNIFPCYRSIVDQISDTCFSVPRNPYVLNQLKIFANLCVADNQIHHMVRNLISESCANISKDILNVF